MYNLFLWKRRCGGGAHGGRGYIPMYLGTHIIFLKHLVRGTTILLKLNDLLKKLGV